MQDNAGQKRFGVILHLMYFIAATLQKRPLRRCLSSLQNFQSQGFTTNLVSVAIWLSCVGFVFQTLLALVQYIPVASYKCSYRYSMAVGSMCLGRCASTI